MTPAILLVGVAPAGGALAVLTEALSRKKDLLPLVRHPVRPLAEQGDGFVHAQGRLEAAHGWARPGAHGGAPRRCLAWRLRLEARANLGGLATELWSAAWRQGDLVLRDAGGTAALADSVSLDFAWHECVFEVFRGADGDLRATPELLPAAERLRSLARAPGARRGVRRVAPDGAEAGFAATLVREVLRQAPAGALPPNAPRHVVVLWTDVDPDEEVRVYGAGRLVVDPDGDRGGGYRDAPRRLRVESAGATRAGAEPAAFAEAALRLLRWQVRGGLGMLAFGIAWAVGFFV